MNARKILSPQALCSRMTEKGLYEVSWIRPEVKTCCACFPCFVLVYPQIGVITPLLGLHKGRICLRFHISLWRVSLWLSLIHRNTPFKAEAPWGLFLASLIFYHMILVWQNFPFLSFRLLLTYFREGPLKYTGNTWKASAWVFHSSLG